MKTKETTKKTKVFIKRIDDESIFLSNRYVYLVVPKRSILVNWRKLKIKDSFELSLKKLK